MDQDDIDRFWKLVDVRGDDECWELTGQNNEYGTFMVDGKHMRGNRFAWLATNGDPGELWVLHTCDNRICMNPRHLFLGTPAENTLDMYRKGRHPGARLNHEKARRIRELLAAGMTRAELAKQFQVSQALIGHVVRGETWR